MLVLCALLSFGLTSNMTRVALDCETLGEANSGQSEELEERVSCSSARREKSLRARRDTAQPLGGWTSVLKNVSHCETPRAIVGHRLNNGSLAPIRC